MVFHWSVSDSKSPQISRTLLNNVVFWMVSIRPPTSKSPSPFNNPLVTIPKAPITIGTIVIFMFHSFFQFPSEVEVLILFFTFFQFYSVVNTKNIIFHIVFYHDNNVIVKQSLLSFTIFLFVWFLRLMAYKPSWII